MKIPLLVLLIAVLAVPAQAAIAPKYLLEARAEAQSHVQVEVWSIVRDKAAHTCHLRTVVRNAWPQNGHPIPKAGSGFDFDVPCAFAGDELPTGGTLWFRAADIHLHMILEGYFDGNTAVRDQVFEVPYPRARPWCDTTHEACDLEM